MEKQSTPYCFLNIYLISDCSGIKAQGTCYVIGLVQKHGR